MRSCLLLLGALVITVLKVGSAVILHAGAADASQFARDDLEPLSRAEELFGVVPDDLRSPDDGSDNAPSIQRAVDRLCRRGGGTLRLLAHVYAISSKITQSCLVNWRGTGWQEPNGGDGTAVPGAGTWLSIARPDFTPITIVGAGTNGSSFENFGIYQVHSAPAASWSPTLYPFVFSLERNNGEVSFRHLMFLAVNRGIEAFYAGRLKVEDIRGQFFTVALSADKNYDTSIIADVRNWPYWSQDPRVITYQQNNLDMLVFGRMDDTFADRLFSYGSRSVLKLVTTKDDSTTLSLPGGSVTTLHVGIIRGDFTRWVVWNTAVASYFGDVSVSIESLVAQGQDVWAAAPLTNAAAIRNDGSFTLWSIGFLRADFIDAALIDARAAVASSTLQIGRALVRFDPSTRGFCNMLLQGFPPSKLEFALRPMVSSGTNQVVDLR